MWVAPEVISCAAQLILSALDEGLPIEEMAEFRGFGDDDAAALARVIDELNWPDLVVSLRLAAERIPEPAYDEDGGGEGRDGA